MNHPQAPPISKQLIAERFARARDTYSREAHVQREVAGTMLKLLDGLTPAAPRHIFEFGCGTGIYSRLLLEHFSPERLVLNDLCPEMEECIMSPGTHPGGVSFMAGDAESLPLPTGMELITSCSTLQWFAAPGRFFARCHTALRPGGLLAFSTFGGENLREIRHLTGRGLTYLSPARLRECLEPHFEVLHLSDEVVSLPLASPLHVLRHLRQTGVTGTGGGLWTPRRLQRFCNEYTRLYTDGRGEVSLTYHPIYVVARKRADGVTGL